MDHIGNEVVLSDTFPTLALATLSPRAAGLPLKRWLPEREAAVALLLRERGGVLFRDFAVDDADLASDLLPRLVREPLTYEYRSTPRTTVGANTYTATEYPRARSIPLHNENSYQRDWPMHVVFHSTRPAASGGETLIADTHLVTARIGGELLDRWGSRGITYVRNYRANLDLDWQVVFQTQNRSEVERYCRSNDISLSWNDDGSLRTSQRCHVVADHPYTGVTLWFNQAHLFHVSSVGHDTELALVSLYGQMGTPRNAFLGETAPLPTDDLAVIRQAYSDTAHPLRWERGDILLLDNMRFAHGRNPYTGERRLLFAMGDPHSRFASQCALPRRDLA